MARQKDGAAIRQDHRSNGTAARSRKPHQSIPAWGAGEEWGLGKTVATVAAGSAFLYAFMWLAAAF